MRIFVVVMILTGLALAPAPPAFADPVTIAHTDVRDIASSEDGRVWRLFIWKPKSPPSEAGFPVVYVTDANAIFATFADAMNARSQSPGGARIDPTVIVGIGYPGDAPFDMLRRARDLTPEVDRATLPVRPDGSAWPPTGGADDFLAFIENQVKPLVEREIRIDKTRETLFGHSFGGLFALHVLLTKSDAFDSYVAASPSIWFGNRHLLTEAEKFTAKVNASPVDADLFIGVGEWEQVLSPTEAAGAKAAERAARKAQNRMVDNARDMKARLGGLEAQGLRLTYREFAEEDHISVLPVIAGRALGFVADLR